MKKLLLFIFTLLSSKIVLADVGIPLLLAIKPLAICTLLPVILIEWGYFKYKYKNLVNTFGAITRANLFSTAVGFFIQLPILILILILINPILGLIVLPFLVLLGNLIFYKKHQKLCRIVTVICAFWSLFLFICLFENIPLDNLNSNYFWWWEKKEMSAIILLPSLVLDCIASWFLESCILELEKSFSKIKKKSLLYSVFWANIYSYIFLFLIVFIYYL